MDPLSGFLSVLMHAFITALLVVYMPVSLLCKLIRRVFLRPFLDEDMRGKVVLITGASSGIGEELAYQYARRGASLALVARREAALKGVAKRAREQGAMDVIVIPADISSSSESERVVQETVTHFGQLNHLVANAGIWSTCIFDEITNISAFTQVMDVNFWGAVYPTYYAIPHLKKSRGKIVVNASMAGSFPTARMTFYNASKAAVIRFYETLRSELGSEVGINIVTLGYVASELTKGKAMQQNGEVGTNEEARDIQIGPFPVGRTDECAEAIVRGACRGDEYMTWPSWYQPLHALMCLAPEIVNWFSHSFHVSRPGDDPNMTMSKRILEAMGAKAKDFLYPSSIKSPPASAAASAAAANSKELH